MEKEKKNAGFVAHQQSGINIVVKVNDKFKKINKDWKEKKTLDLLEKVHLQYFCGSQTFPDRGPLRILTVRRTGKGRPPLFHLFHLMSPIRSYKADDTSVRIFRQISRDPDSFSLPGYRKVMRLFLQED